MQKQPFTALFVLHASDINNIYFYVNLISEMDQTDFDKLKEQWEDFKKELARPVFDRPQIEAGISTISEIIDTADTKTKRATKKMLPADKENKLKKLIKDGCELNYNFKEVETKIGNINECVQTLCNIEQNLKSAKRTKLIFYSSQGQVIHHLRRFNRNYNRILEQAGLNFSKSYCSALISFFKLTEEFPGLKACACSFHEVRHNFVLIEKICNDLKNEGFW